MSERPGTTPTSSLFHHVRCNACGNVWLNDTGVCEECGARNWVPVPDVDFGPTEVVVNGVRYVREETLFAALTALDELRAENERRDEQRKAAE